MNTHLGNDFNGEQYTLDEGLIKVDEVVELLDSIGVVAKSASHLEDDYLQLHCEVKAWKDGDIGNWTNPTKAAFYGFIELHSWLWSVKDHPEFEKIIPHLTLLMESSIRFNAESPMINPVSGRQDDKSNKLIETFLGMYALKIGTDLDLDDPYESSGGTNPDILFTHNNKRIAIACKTPRSTHFETILDNCRSAKVQIDRAECDVGFIAINAMNQFPHYETNDYVYNSPEHVGNMLGTTVDDLLHYFDMNARPIWQEIFTETKMTCSVITLVNSATQIKNENTGGHDDYSMKRICNHRFDSQGPEQWLADVLDNINLFLHTRPMSI